MALYDAIKSNPALVTLVAYLLTGVLTAAFKPRTDAQWAAMPKWAAGSLKFLSAVGFDPVKFVEALVTLLKVPYPGDGTPPAPPPPANPPGDAPTDQR